MTTEEALKVCDTFVGPWPWGERYSPLWDRVYMEFMGQMYARHFDKEGRPISLRVWTMLRAIGPLYVRVDGTRVGDVWVSTVWLGIDYGDRHIFETLCFDHEGSMGDTMVRYSTLNEAQKGHMLVVKEMAAGGLEPPTLGSSDRRSTD